MANPFGHLMPIYPLIAQQILDDYQISSGKCLDIGTGHGFLGIELAKITELEMYFIDIDPEALNKAKNNVLEYELNNEVHFVGADVTALPFEDNFAELVISRGSLWFWHDQVKGLQEIYRVLKAGGAAFVGGGLGRYTPPTMRRRLQGEGRQRLEAKGEKGFLRGKKLEELLFKTGIKSYFLISDVEGEPCHWIEIRKE
ncbi:class I SAM-dependent methyltransferase [Petroclostridium sp. X23]|uniref:class I SAM-dependent methyltransferase n=1 Tax=Petroclostridium sp. X23 TaxID=3045146 RepID=UPI0024AE3911|nr:class I SAM-dependent methyltransferase [Petroclostridium sp. X23]WHH60993.1 class I SAM-dependent methyltransferase [Petroclostridium sp. X23]